jgi:hypothetical protein
MNQLLTLGFIESATAEINDNNFRININKNEFASNILYAFAIECTAINREMGKRSTIEFILK